MKLKITILALAIIGHALAGQPLNPDTFSATNSAYDEQNPVLSPDGTRLFFTVANHPENLGGKKDPGDIWYCTLQSDNSWSAPVHGGRDLNDKAYNSIAGFSADGGEMFLLGHYTADGSLPRTQGIAIATRTASGWTRPQNVSIPFFQNKSHLISGYISPDKSVFLFSAETYGTYGVEDLYVSLRTADGKWSEPRNLGPQINTPFQELAPSLSADGKTLYFSTNGRRGSGSFDIFSTRRTDDSWSHWTTPENLASVNTEGRDLYFKDFSQAGLSLYTTTKNSDGYGDIRTYIPPVPPVTQEPLADNRKDVIINPVVEPQAPAVTDKPAEKPAAVRVYGKVTNDKTGETIAANVTFEAGPDQPAKRAGAEREGYEISLPTTATYTVRIEAPGFISAREKLEVQSLEMENLEMNFRLKPIEVGTTVNLRDVLFEQSKTALLPQSYPELDLVVSFMKQNPNVSIELSGHTDNRGNPFQNVKLSQARVDVVKQYLISKGIEPRRVTGKGFGGNKPIADNNSEETRKLNRRVEFTINKN